MYFQWIHLVFGLIIGSFLNAAVYRIKTKKDLWLDRSICPKCKHKLGFLDLFPVLSYLLLAGKCRYCKKKISIQYPVVELSTAILYLLNYQHFLRFPDYASQIWGALGLILLPLMVFIFIYDLKYRLILNGSVLTIYALGLIYLISAVAVSRDPASIIVPALTVGGGLFAFFYALFYISNGRWMGGGDVKLMPSYALFFGYLALQAVFLAFILGSIVGIFLLTLKKKKMKSAVPFGPFLVTGFILTFFLQGRIWTWFSLTLYKLLGFS